LFVEWEDISGEIPIQLNIIFPESNEPHPIKPGAILKGQQGIVARSMIVLNGFQFPKAGPTVFRFLAHDKVIGEETLIIEKFQQQPGAAAPGANATLIN